MSSLKNLSVITALTLAVSLVPESGVRSIWGQGGPADPAVAAAPEGSLDIEEFLNQNSTMIESQMNGDFFDRLEDPDKLPAPEKAGNVPEPQVLNTNDGENVEVIPDPVNEPVPSIPDEKEEVSLEAAISMGSNLPTYIGVPENYGATGNYARATAETPSLHRDIPLEALGEDGFGNPYTGAGYGAFGGYGGGMGYGGSFDEVRHFTHFRYMMDQSHYTAGSFFVTGSASAGGVSEKDWQLSPAIGTGTPDDVNDSGSDFGMNQLYLSFGKQVDRGDTWSLGAQADLLYGTDYIWASSIGLESDKDNAAGGRASRVSNALPHWSKNSKGGYAAYGLALPQAYGEIYAPWFSGLDIKIGHFYAPMGHEAVQSSKNFFYTHSYSFSYGMPHTFTGLLGDLKVNPGISLQAGFSQGWDTWADNKGSLDVMGGFVFQITPVSSWSFFVNTGDAITDNIYDSVTNEFLRCTTANQTTYSLVYQRKCFGNLSWAIEHDFGFAENGAATLDANGETQFESGDWYSLVNYLYYDVMPNMTLGFRFEWFKDRNYTRTIGDYAVNQLAGYKWDGDNFYDFSLGLNWQIMQNIRFRPEVRYDYSTASMVALDNGEAISSGVFDDFTKSNMWTVGGDILVEF